MRRDHPGGMARYRAGGQNSGCFADQRFWILVRSLVTTNSPLGNMADLVPPLRNMTLFNIASYETEYLSTLFYLTVPVGASFVTKQFVTRVVNYAVARLSPQLENFRSHQLASSGKKFWISIRTRNRTAVNQVEFLVALVNHLLKSFDGCTVLLDGHSTPMDIQHNKSYDQADVVKTIENDTNVVGAVMSGLHKVNMPTDRVISAVGLPILDSIALAGIADFYICHHGTLQHKIGWFYSKPGIVHAPNSILAQGEAVASWVTAQSETAIAPVYLPADHVQDTEVPNEFSSYPKHLKLDNYFIVNIPDAIEMILKCAKYHLS